MPFVIRAFVILASLSVVIKAAHIFVFRQNFVIDLPVEFEATDMTILVMCLATVIGSVFYLSIIWLAGFRHENVARWAFLLLTVFSLLFCAAADFLTPLSVPLEGTVDLVCGLLQVASLGFVFSPSAKNWFMKKDAT